MNFVSVILTQQIRAGTHDFLNAETANYTQTIKVLRVAYNLIESHYNELLI